MEIIQIKVDNDPGLITFFFVFLLLSYSKLGGVK